MMKRYKDAKNLFDNEEEQVAKEMMFTRSSTSLCVNASMQSQ